MLNSMNCKVFFSPNFSRAVLAAAIAVACSNASALTTLPEFTWNPAADRTRRNVIHGGQHHRLRFRDGDIYARQHIP